jgi:hypothetical protein
MFIRETSHTHTNRHTPHTNRHTQYFASSDNFKTCYKQQ